MLACLHSKTTHYFVAAANCTGTLVAASPGSLGLPDVVAAAAFASASAVASAAVVVVAAAAAAA
eukprot:CAMPEP_0181033298 /NCGR_PEP_ID=MMETSP1070-20121207/7183_1 /TAXON_ID=265543 /ORGANISM="Minutocellus polymorphus, Strain NH13" /LENGTH=63 /DNA_ID=CAMNT_0023110717 /DNA_START=73 /DNA_END=261 /DNA_ORIENTATION=-